MGTCRERFKQCNMLGAVVGRRVEERRGGNQEGIPGTEVEKPLDQWFQLRYLQGQASNVNK